MNYLKKNNYPILAFFIVIFGFIIILISVAIIVNSSVEDVFLNFLTNLYRPSKNLFTVETVLGVKIYVYFYLVFGCASGFIFLVRFFFKRFSIQRMFIATCYSFLFLMMGLQIISQYSYFLIEYDLFHNKTLQEKVSVRFKNSYAFAQYCRTKLPGKHWGVPVTDIDIQKTQGMLTFFSVAYYLYPINIRTGKEQPKDCLVIFLKDEPLKSVSAGFKALEPFDSTSLLAVKEK